MMKHLPYLLLGAGLGVGATWLMSATSATFANSAQSSSMKPDALKVGGTLLGFNLMGGTAKAMSELGPETPVTIREVRGDWLLVDYPSQATGPVWVNQNALISFRSPR